MLNRFYSNRVENLCGKLVSTLSKPLSSPFDKEIIIVQSRGMEKYLSLKISESFGIAANLEFLYPDSAMEYCFSKIIDMNEGLRFNRDSSVFPIMEMIISFEESEIFQPVFRYSGYGANMNYGKLYQLCLKLSDLFLQYQIFRPEMLLSWKNGNYEESNWQAVLWNEFSNKHKIETRADLLLRAIDSVKEGKSDFKNLPERISVFGIFSLPKLYLDILKFFSFKSSVDFYLLNPCMEYWGDIVSERTMERAGTEALETKAYLHSGNSLLSSLGKSGRNFLNTMEEYDFSSYDEDFFNSEESSLLSIIQNNILCLEDNTEKVVLDKNDKSLIIHSCHGPMREMEVLRDDILALMEEDGDLEFGDILVMMPDVENYSPYIESVFSRPVNGVRIPFSISDRSLASKFRLINTFILVLELMKSRFEASSVLNILSLEGIRDRFSFSDEDIERARKWFSDLNFSWGIDAEFRGKKGAPKENFGTFSKVLDLLVLGFSMRPEHGAVFRGLSPYMEIDSSDMELFSGVSEFFMIMKRFETLFSDGFYSVEEWSDMLFDLFSLIFVEKKETEEEFLEIKSILTSMKDGAFSYDLSLKLPFDVIFSRIKKEFEKKSSFSGFLDGRITFCSMLPMRSIPFKMIAVAGLGNNDFPRNFVSPEFDLMKINPEKGDPSLRDDDRYLFLETLICARKYFHIFYTGRDFKTDSEIPPSTIVLELEEYISNNFRSVDDEDIKSRIVIEHKAVPFSKEYFRQERPWEKSPFFSYDMEMKNIAESLSCERVEVPLFISEEQGEAEPYTEAKAEDNLINDLDVNDLVRFFNDPQSFYLKGLGFDVYDREHEIRDSEIFIPDGLDGYRMENELLNNILEYDDTAHSKIIFESRNILSSNHVSSIFFNEMKKKVLTFGEELKDKLSSKERVVADFHLKESGLRLFLETELCSGDLISYRTGKFKASVMLGLWIKFLFLSIADKGFKGKALFYYMEKKKEVKKNIFSDFSPELSDHLFFLVDTYISSAGKPLKFHPELSYEYASRLLKYGEKKNIEEIRSSFFSYLRSNAQYMNLGFIEKIFGVENFFDEEFYWLSERIFTPLMENMI